MTAKLSDKSNILPPTTSHNGIRTSPPVHKSNKTKVGSKKKWSRKVSKKSHVSQSHHKPSEHRGTSQDHEKDASNSNPLQSNQGNRTCQDNIGTFGSKGKDQADSGNPAETTISHNKEKPHSGHHKHKKTIPVNSIVSCNAATVALNTNANRSSNATILSLDPASSKRESALSPNAKTSEPSVQINRVPASTHTLPTQRDRRPHHSNRGNKFKNNRKYNNSHGYRRSGKKKESKEVIDTNDVKHGRDANSIRDNEPPEISQSECERMEHSSSPQERNPLDNRKSIGLINLKNYAQESDSIELASGFTQNHQQSNKSISSNINDSQCLHAKELPFSCNDISNEEETNGDIVNAKSSEQYPDGTSNKNVRTNAAGLALLNKISARICHEQIDERVQSQTTFDDENRDDGTLSLELNQSSTEKSDLAEDMHRIDPCLDQGQEPYDDSSSTTEMFQAGWSGMAEQGIPPQQHTQYQQYPHPWLMMPNQNGLNDDYNYVQEPIFIATTPYYGQECIVTQPYAYPIGYAPFPNIQSYEQDQITPNPKPLRYEQISISGTVFFNPVFVEESKLGINSDDNGETYVSDKVRGEECKQDVGEKKANDSKRTDKNKRNGKANKKKKSRGNGKMGRNNQK